MSISELRYRSGGCGRRRGCRWMLWPARPVSAGRCCSLIERSESSPTAVILERLAVGLNVTLATLFEAVAESEVPEEPVQRRVSQAEWRDPETGYVRRNLSPPHVPQPLQLVEIELPAKARVVFESKKGTT